MEELTLAQILNKMDERTAQIAQIISNQTMALENIARYAEVMAQSMQAIQQRQVFAMEERTIALKQAALAMEISSEILKQIRERI